MCVRVCVCVGVCECVCVGVWKGGGSILATIVRPKTFSAYYMGAHQVLGAHIKPLQALWLVNREKC